MVLRAVSSFGSIFDGTEPTRGGPRGPDLRVTVEVPRTALGSPDGFAAPIPTTVEVDGRSIERVRGPEGEGPVPLFLPATLPSGAVLRLRGQGGRSPTDGGPPGDLLVEIVVVDRPSRRWLVPVVIGLGVLTAAAAAAVALL